MLCDERKRSFNKEIVQLFSEMKDELIQQYCYIIGFQYFLINSGLDFQKYENRIDMKHYTLDEKRTYLSDLISDGYYDKLYQIVDDNYLVLPNLLDSFTEMLDDIDRYVSECKNDADFEIDSCKGIVMLNAALDFFMCFDDVIYYISQDGLDSFQDSGNYDEFINSFSHNIGKSFNMSDLIFEVEKKADDALALTASKWVIKKTPILLNDLEILVFDYAVSKSDGALDSSLRYYC